MAVRLSAKCVIKLDEFYKKVKFPLYFRKLLRLRRFSNPLAPTIGFVTRNATKFFPAKSIKCRTR